MPCRASLAVAVRGAVLLLLASAAVAPASAAADEGAVGGKPFLDTRKREEAALAPPVVAARQALDARLGALGSVETEPRTGGVADVRRADGFLTGPSGRDPADIALGYVRDRPDVFGLDGGDLAALRLDARSISPDGITTLRWVQTAGGIASLDTGIVAHVAPGGRLVAIGGGARADLALEDRAPGLGPATAYREALADAGAPLVVPRADTAAGAERGTTFADGGRAELAVFAGADGGRLVWRTIAYGDDGLGYEQAIDARDGSVLHRRPLTSHERHAEVYRRFPGAATGGAPERVDLGADPAWLDDDASHTRLRGNNAHAYSDRTANNVADPGEDVPAGPDGNWIFALQPVPSSGGCPAAPAFCTWNAADATSLALNGAASATNLFFHVNAFHDHLLAAPIGFDEASGNFEQVHSGEHGRPGDRVRAENDDGGGFDNANFATPPDGSPPRMQLYPRRGAFDLHSGLSAETIYHEYAHGLTNRLVVGAAGGSTLVGEQARSMGEGWSDWFALDFLAGAGYAVDGPATGDLSYGAYWNGTGVRTQAIDCPPGVTAARCAAGGWSYQDIRRLTWPHTTGEMWSQTLWDIRRAVGSVEARRLVAGGLRLSPPDPTFLDMRDAILGVDLATGGAHRSALWRVFAARGLGVRATSDTTDVTSATEAFDTPAPAVDDDPPVRERAGDHDGVPEPGETVEVFPRLRNSGIDALPALTGAIASATDGVRIEDPAVAWPALDAPLETATSDAPVTLKIDEAVRCGTPALLRATVDGRPALPFRLRLGPAGAPGTTTWATQTSGAAIPDGSDGGVSSTIVVPGPGVPIQDVDVRLDQLTHEWLGDLRVVLQRDGGPRVALIDHPGGGDARGGTLTGTILDDEAAVPMSSALSPSAGRYRPASALSQLDGQPTAGTWKLTVIDSWPGSTGTLGAWSLGFTEQGGCEENSARATTAPAIGVTGSEATVGGMVDAAGAATQWRVAYGTTATYGETTAVTSAGSQRSASARTARLTGLAPDTAYHFRVEALRFGEVVARGEDATFMTTGADTREAGPDRGPPAGEPPGGPPAGEDPVPVATPAAPEGGHGGGAAAGPERGDGAASRPGAGRLPAITPPPAVGRRLRADAPRAGRIAFSFRTAPGALRVRAGRVVVPFSAPPGSRGSVTLRAAGTTIGSARFTVGAGGRVRALVRLTAGGRAAVRRSRRRAVLATVTVRAGAGRAVHRVTVRR